MLKVGDKVLIPTHISLGVGIVATVGPASFTYPYIVTTSAGILHFNKAELLVLPRKITKAQLKMLQHLYAPKHPS